MFHVKSLSLNRQNSWHSNPDDWGPLVGKMELADKNETAMTLKLTQEQTQRILQVVAEAIVQSAREQAKMIAADVVAQAGGVKLITGIGCSSKDDGVTDVPF